MSRLRCPLRIPGVVLGKVAGAGADPGAGCIVSTRCGTAFGAVNEVLEFAGNLSAMFDKPPVPIAAQVQAQCRPATLSAETMFFRPGSRLANHMFGSW